MKTIAILLFLAGFASAQIIPQKPQLEQDLAKLEASIHATATALHHAATVLKSEHDAIWSLPIERLLPLLNADVQRTMAISAAKIATAQAINAQLDALGDPRYSNRAPVDPIGREGVAFDPVAMKFTYTAPPEPELPTPPNP